ncbi:MAG: F0F1 ATP synthase subunit epsilon [Thauera sp.]
MSSFQLVIASPLRVERIDAVASFVGRDASGQFGLLAQHEPFITVLEWGLARFRTEAAPHWRYIALPGGTLRYYGGQLQIATRNFVIGEALATVAAALKHDTAREADQRAALRGSLDQLEQALMQRLWRMEG